jgi:hypothetical protein
MSLVSSCELRTTPIRQCLFARRKTKGAVPHPPGTLAHAQSLVNGPRIYERSPLATTQPSFQIQFSKSGFGNRPVVSRRDCARGLRFRSLEEGAGNAGCALHPRPRVRKKAHALATKGTPQQPAFPARVVLTVSFALSSVTMLGCHRRSPDSLKPATLAPASERQDHTTSPSAAVAFVSSPLPRPPHPAPNVRDDRDTPLSKRRDVRKEAINRGGGEANYFSPPDWTTQISLIRLDKLLFSRMRVLGSHGRRGRAIAMTSGLILPVGRIALWRRGGVERRCAGWVQRAGQVGLTASRAAGGAATCGNKDEGCSG